MRSLTLAAAAFLMIGTIFGVGIESPDSASAATVALKWGAPIEVAGVRPVGSATLFVYTSGTGALGLRLTGLAPSSSYWVALYSGTCAKIGARVVALPTVASTASGTVTRGVTLSRALTARIRTLLRGRLSVAIGSVRRCGTLAPISLSPGPTPTPTPSPTLAPAATPTPTPTLTPTPSPVPAPYDPGPPPPPYTY